MVRQRVDDRVADGDEPSRFEQREVIDVEVEVHCLPTTAHSELNRTYQVIT